MHLVYGEKTGSGKLRNLPEITQPPNAKNQDLQADSPALCQQSDINRLWSLVVFWLFLAAPRSSCLPACLSGDGCWTDIPDLGPGFCQSLSKARSLGSPSWEGRRGFAKHRAAVLLWGRRGLLMFRGVASQHSPPSPHEGSVP